MENLGTYLTAQEVADALKISRSGVFALVKKGKFPHGILIGGSRRWELHELKEALSAMKGDEK